MIQLFVGQIQLTASFFPASKLYKQTIGPRVAHDFFFLGIPHCCLHVLGRLERFSISFILRDNAYFRVHCVPRCTMHIYARIFAETPFSRRNLV